MPRREEDGDLKEGKFLLFVRKITLSHPNLLRRDIYAIYKWRCSIYGIQLPEPRGSFPNRFSAFSGLAPTLLTFTYSHIPDFLIVVSVQLCQYRIALFQILSEYIHLIKYYIYSN